VEAPAFDAAVRSQIEHVTAELGAGDLERALRSGSSWVVG
jgi:hypothetical protein